MVYIFILGAYSLGLYVNKMLQKYDLGKQIFILLHSNNRRFREPTNFTDWQQSQ